MATPNYKPLLNSSENLKALLAEQNAEGITSAVLSGNEPIDVLSAKTIFNAAKSAEDIAGVSSITAGTGISVSGATGAVTISSTVTGTLPTQTGNSGKILTTDGTNASWTTTPIATSLTGPSATSLTLSGGSSGASLSLGATTSGVATLSTGLRLNPTISTMPTGGAYGQVLTSSTGGSGVFPFDFLGHLVLAPRDNSALGVVVMTGTGLANVAGYFTGSGNLLIGTTTDMSGSAGVKIAGTTASTGLGTGALQVAGGIYAGAASVFNSPITVGSTYPITLGVTGAARATFTGVVNDGIELAAQASGTYGTANTASWYLADGTTRRAYLGYVAANDQNFDIGTTEAGGIVRLYSGNGTLTQTLSNGAATFAGAVTSPTITHTPAAAPASPASGWVIYVDSGDGNKLKAKASTGTVVTLGTP